MIFDFKHIKKTIKPILLRPPYIRHCSQTIYEALLGCCRMWESTSDLRWRTRADRLLEILLSIQQPDGGFDIGYNFNFGQLHRKGQSTSPELVGLVALSEYARLFGKEQVAPAAEKASNWIRIHSMDMGDGKIAIPYSPHTIKEVMVYNGTSFTCGALGCYLGQFGGDDELRHIYHGMVRYLESVLSRDENLPGRFWYYCDQSRTDMDDLRRGKIDYYHQMQQVEMHALAQQAFPVEIQIKIIRDVADHIVDLHHRLSVVPYANDIIFFNNQIHMWGLSSVASGLLEAANVIRERQNEYRRVARKVLEWIVEYSWNGEHFRAILNQDGSSVKPCYYMVRSDAWVFNALAASSKYLGNIPWEGVIESCFNKMNSVAFSGPESHASNALARVIRAVRNRGV